jgi:hypothetical protein
MNQFSDGAIDLQEYSMLLPDSNPVFCKSGYRFSIFTIFILKNLYKSGKRMIESHFHIIRKTATCFLNKLPRTVIPILECPK